MKVQLSWINDYVDISKIELPALTKGLTDAGFEVEEIIDYSKGLEKVVSAKITQITPHPNADKLVVCIANIGTQNIQIVTGAKNMKEGDIVALALDGANLPNGQLIKNGSLRGVDSNGMFCGADEIGVDNSIYPNAENNGLLILSPDEPIGENIAKILGLNEIVLDVNVLPNRADCNSIIGIAKEIAAIFNLEYKAPSLDYTTAIVEKNIEVEVKNKEYCTRYMGVTIDNIIEKTTPIYMQRRLKLAGHTPHNILVDITNYILVEIGQPMHAFDADKIVGSKIIVRDATNGESLVVLNEKEYNLSSNHLVIADTEKPLVIAGIMGGMDSGTYPTTKSIFLECATFDYASVRRASSSLGLMSDSSIRYSKGVYKELAEIGMKRALHLICKLGLGKISTKTVDIVENLHNSKIITTNIEGIKYKLAMDITAEKMISILNSLDITSKIDGENIVSTIPVERTDIERECDIIEEIGRIYGYDNIDLSKTTPSKNIKPGTSTKKQMNINIIKKSSASQGFSEMISWQFISPKNIENLNMDPNTHIKLKNPLGTDYSIMRKSLIPSVLSAVSHNQKLGNKEIRLFEQARVFLPKSLPLTELPDEKEYLCLAINTDGEDFYSLKHMLNEIIGSMNTEVEYIAAKNEFLHPGICADVLLYKRKIGTIGKLHPTVAENFEISKDTFIAEIDLTALLTRSPENRTLKAPPKLPLIEKDIAVLVKQEISASSIINAIMKSAKQDIDSANIFDIYEGTQIENGFKSVAITLKIKQNEKSLTDKDISNIMNNAISILEKEVGAKLR